MTVNASYILDLPGSKTMMELKGEGITGDIEVFRKPIFQTFGMFVGMVFGLVMHGFVLFFKIPFPGYNHTTSRGATDSDASPSEKTTLMAKSGKADEEKVSPTSQSLPVWMYFFLAIPSIFDLGATVLCMMGLQYIDVSIYQLLRGSGIIFVALMKQHVLGDPLYRFQWVGVVWNVMSVFLVGGTAILNEDPEEENTQSGSALLGVLLVMAGAVVQAMQFVFEEKVMTMDIPSPPLLLIGMEGLWGTFLCLFVVYPLAYYLPGSDHGSYEDFHNTWHMITHSPVIQYSFVIYFFGKYSRTIVRPPACCYKVSQDARL
jgi:drug/metabolite transporter (DMT)-like permease